MYSCVAAAPVSPSSPTLPDDKDNDSDEEELALDESTTDKTGELEDSRIWTHSESFTEPPEQQKQQPESMSATPACMFNDYS